MQRLIAMRTNVCSHLGRGVRGGCERSRHTEGQPGVSQREVLRDVCRAAESRREAPAWSGIFGSNARGSSCEPKEAAEYVGPRQSLRGETAPVQCSGTWPAAPTCLRRATAARPAESLKMRTTSRIRSCGKEPGRGMGVKPLSPAVYSSDLRSGQRHEGPLAFRGR
jgi:hypothetical protein